MAQKETQKTAKPPPLNLLPTQSADMGNMGNKRIEDFANAQTELLDKLQETNRQWLDRQRPEAGLASEFACKLTTARSIPDAITACRDWAGRRFAMMAQDRKHLLSAGAGIHLANSVAQRFPLPIAEPIANPMLGPGPQPQPCADGVGIGPLVFRCPTTGHNIESGIEMDLQTVRRVGHLSVRLRCRGCGRPHELEVADGCLASYRMPPGVGDLYRPDVSAEEHTRH